MSDSGEDAQELITGGGIELKDVVGEDADEVTDLSDR